MKLSSCRTPNDASGVLGVLGLRLLEFLSSKRPSVQEKLGTMRLDEARDLAQRNEDLISPSDLKIAKDKLLQCVQSS
jgi:hypothetical protein